MKKLLLSLAACAMAITASAANPTLYLRGAINNWGTSAQFTESNGVYTITMPKLSGEFKVADGTWGDYNFGAAAGKNVVSLDTPVTLEKGSNTNLTTGANTFTDVTVTFTLSDLTLVVKGASQANDYTCVYLVGDFGSGWSEENTNYPLNLKAGTTNTYEGTYTLSNATNYFKMKAGSLVYGTGGDDITVQMGNSYTASQAGNAFVIGSGTYTFTYVLDKNADTGKLVVTGDGQTPTPGETDYSSWYVNVIGEFNGWADNGVHPVDGISTTADLAIGNKGFKVKVWNGTADAFYFSDGNAIPTEEWVQLSLDNVDGTPVQIAGATEGSVYTVKFNCATNEVYVTSNGDSPVLPPTPEVTIPETLYMLGNVNGLDWSTSEGVAATNNNGVFSWVGVKVDGNDGKGYINLATALGENWDAVNAGDRFGASANDTPLAADDVVEITYYPANISASGCQSWMISNGTYDFVADLNNMTFTATVNGNTEPDEPVGPTPDPTATVIYVVGAAEGLGWDLPGKEYTIGADGNFTLQLNNLTKFKFSTIKAESWDDFNLGAYATGNVTFNNSVANANGQTLPLVSWGDDQLVPYTADYTITIKGDFSEMNAYTATKPSTEAPALYLRGDMNDWGAPDAWKFDYNKDENVYTFVCQDATMIVAGDSFKIADANWGAYNFTYGAEVYLSEKETTVEFHGNDMTNTTLSEDFVGTIVVEVIDSNAAQVTFKSSKTNAVEALEAAEGEAVYFNLQGQRVANPDKGIFVKVLNGKAVKVVK